MQAINLDRRQLLAATAKVIAVGSVGAFSLRSSGWAAAPRGWAERAYHKLIYFHQTDKGGHFAASEQPELFSAELRAAFGSLRQST